MKNGNGEDRVFNMDDKDLVIISVTVIGIIALFVLTDPTTILSSIISGLFGVATGKGLSK